MFSAARAKTVTAMASKLKVFAPDSQFYRGVPALEKLIEDNWDIISYEDLLNNPSLASVLQVAAWTDHYSSLIPDLISRGSLPALKLVVNHGVGVNHVPFSLLKEKGVRVANTPAVLADAGADMAMALLLASGRQLIKGYKWAMKSGDEAPDLFKRLELGQDISFATLGIVGMGSIGFKVAQRAKAFNMTILYHNRNRRSEVDEQEVSARYFTDLSDMLPQCDYVVISCPLTESTKGLFSHEQFKKMKTTSHLINIARGPVVNTDSLVEALKNGEINGAALDVTDPEPLPSHHPLLSLDNVLIVPHWGSASVQTRAKMIQLMINNAKEFTLNQTLLTEVYF